MIYVNEIPKRNRIDLGTPAENAIRTAKEAVESAGCDERITRSLGFLSMAQNLVADFVDDVEPPICRQLVFGPGQSYTIVANQPGDFCKELRELLRPFLMD
jgi:hypothetical protein